MKKRYLSLCIVLILMFTLAACSSSNSTSDGETNTSNGNSEGSDKSDGDSGETISLSLGTINTTNSVDGEAAEKFKQLVEDKSDGQLQIELFHNSQLGPTMTQIENTMMGTQDMILTGMELYEKWAPDLKILSAFYVFDDDEHFNKFLKSDIFKNIENQLEQENITWINREYNWVTGPYRVLATTEPVEGLDDLQGMQLRMPEVETLQRSWKQLGAVPVTISWDETYLSLKQNIVEGLEAPISIIRPNKFTEVTKYLTEVRTFPQRMSLAMNLEILNSLPEEFQNILYESATEAGDYYTQLVEQQAEDDLKAMQEEEGVTYFQPDLREWKEKSTPLIYELEKEGYLKEGLYDEIQELK